MSEDSPVGVEVHSAEEEVPGKQITPNTKPPTSCAPSYTMAHHLTPRRTILHECSRNRLHPTKKQLTHSKAKYNGLHRFDTLLMKAKKIR